MAVAPKVNAGAGLVLLAVLPPKEKAGSAGAAFLWAGAGTLLLAVAPKVNVGAGPVLLAVLSKAGAGVVLLAVATPKVNAGAGLVLLAVLPPKEKAGAGTVLLAVLPPKEKAGEGAVLLLLAVQPNVKAGAGGDSSAMGRLMTVLMMMMILPFLIRQPD